MDTRLPARSWCRVVAMPATTLAIGIVQLCRKEGLSRLPGMVSSVGLPRNRDGGHEISTHNGWMIIAIIVVAWLTILVGFVCLRLLVTQRREEEVARDEPRGFVLGKNGSVRAIVRRRRCRIAIS